MKSKNKNLVSGNTAAFEEVAAIIDRSRENVFRSVNRELISMYWEIGQYVSEKSTADNWGKSVVKAFSEFIQLRYVGIKGFSPQNIWRMKQFYETYSDNEKLSPLVRETSWTNNILILMAAKSDEEREFYLLLDDTVVEYALSRSMSPALIAEYQTHLPQKALLENKLRELREFAEAEGLGDEESGGDEE